MSSVPPNSVALAGEFAVLSQLSLRGYDAALTLGHTKNIDILVYEPASQRRLEVEVKTNLERRSGPSSSKLFGRFVTDWQMNEKHEQLEGPTLFYCFVHINEDRGDSTLFAFRFFIVPSAIVARYVRESHRLWLSVDRTHRDTPRRLFKIGLPNADAVALQAPLASTYENNWTFSNSE